MRVRLLTTLAGPDGIRLPGTIDVPPAQARELVAGGFAELLDEWPEETASLSTPVETATRRRKRK